MILHSTYSEAEEFLEDGSYILMKTRHVLGFRVEQWESDHNVAYVTVFPSQGGSHNPRPTVIAIREKAT